MKMAFKSLILTLILSLTVTAQVSDIEQKMIDQGLLDIQELDSTLLVHLVYSTEDNFLNYDAYGDLERCYLQPEPATMLVKASQLLQAEHPDLRLLVYDGVRPRSVQRRMWDFVGGTDLEQYVANPERGSIHNFGSAVDLTLARVDGTPLDMGTVFDHFGEEAHTDEEFTLLEEGRLTAVQVYNRRLLRRVMEEAGFQPIRVEWWHFNAFPSKEARARYTIIE